MQIGLKRGTVALEAWNSAYVDCAREVICVLRDILGEDAMDIQHIGSTSIRGIQSKPIIDLVVGVRDFAEMTVHNAALEEAGIIYRGQDVPEQQLYVIGEGEYRTHHIHVVIHGSREWNNYVNFRDYLNQRPEIALRYSQLKEQLAQEYPDNRGAYTKGKEQLIDEILTQAALWRSLNQDIAITEYDPDPSAVIDPVKILAEYPRVPKVFVSCFALASFERLLKFIEDESGTAPVQIGVIKAANHYTPIYRGIYQGQEIGFVCAYIGAPACVGMCEELFAMGAETVILYGNCGVLDRAIDDVAIILPTSAVRDEGTSFHYVPFSREIDLNTDYGSLFENMLIDLKIPYHKGKTWTTDAMYRETEEKVRRRKAEGCICVEMEASAMAALAKMGGKKVLQFFYAGDNLDTPVWDERSLSQHVKLDEKDKVGLIALEAALRILASEKASE